MMTADMKILLRIFSSIVILLMASCGQVSEKEVSHSFILAGQVRNIPEDGSHTMIINECDPSAEDARIVVEFDSTGCFKAVVPLSYAHSFSVNYARQFVEAYAEPGDSIYIEIDASTVPFQFELSGAHAELNNAFGHASEDVIGLAYEGELPTDTLPLDVYLPAFKTEVARRMALVDDYISQHGINEEAASLLRAHALYTIASCAFDYEGSSREDRLSLLTDSLFDIHNEENLKTMMFSCHLVALAYNFPEQIERMPKSRQRDIMYATRAEEMTPEREAFADTCYYDRIFGVKNPVLEVGEIYPSELVVYDDDSVYTVDKVDPVKWLTEKYDGRPVYLDISAVWCGPCRAGLTESGEVRNAFKDTDVVFAVIWLRSDLERWKELVPTFANAVHIYVGDEDTTNMIMGRFNMRGFPSYYFIDKEKNIHRDAPHITSPELADYLKSALNE